MEYLEIGVPEELSREHAKFIFGDDKRAIEAFLAYNRWVNEMYNTDDIDTPRDKKPVEVGERKVA